MSNLEKQFDACVDSFNNDQNRLRCPFCGHEATAYWKWWSDYRNCWFFIACDRCSCRVKGTSWNETLGEWNTRVTDEKKDKTA